MEDKILKLKEERQKISKSYSKKTPNPTYIDTLANKHPEIQHVIIKEIITETPDTKSFILTPDMETTFELIPFKAGQYISLKLNINDTYVTRAYSLASDPSISSKKYKITIKKVENGLVSNYMNNEVKVGDKLLISLPVGNFGYDPNRDEENVIAIAGGSGITPFMSLAYEIEKNYPNTHLTVFYSVKTAKDIIFKDEIDLINKKSKRVKFVITLTREKKDGYLNGHLKKEMLEPYISEFNTILMCGPKALYQAMNEILSGFNIPKKSVHFENFNIEYTPSENNEYDLKVILKNDFIVTKCKSNETLLEAMEKAHIKAPSMCRVGICGYCRSILLEGKIKMIGSNMPTAASINDYIHPCITYPESNIVIRLDI